MGRCAVLTTRHGARPPGPPWPNLLLYHRASLSGLSELLLRLRTTLTHLFQATRGKRRLLSYLSLRDFALQSSVPFRMKLPASCQAQITKVSTHVSQLLVSFGNSPIIRVLPVLSSHLGPLVTSVGCLFCLKCPSLIPSSLGPA